MAPDQMVTPTAPTSIPEEAPVKIDVAVDDDATSTQSEPDNRDHEIAQKAAHSKLQHDRPHGLYWPAKRLLEWGEVQTGRHASWNDLFWDLIFVGTAFKVGDFFKTNIKHSYGPLVLVGTGLTIVNTWSHLLQYRCRFEANSLYHKVLDILEGLMTAAAAHNVVVDVEAFRAYNMYAFVVMVLICRAVQAVRRLELVLLTPKPGEYGSTRSAALDMLVRTLLEMALLCVAFVFDSVGGVMSVLIGVWLVQVTLFTAPAMLGWYHKRHLVPIHVEYTVRRLGEMVMLMLGEGMLSIVLSESVIDTTNVRECGAECWRGKVKSGTSFASGFVLLSCLMYLYYRSNRFTRHHHAVRRSAFRGIAWNTAHWPLSCALIGMGVCLKSIQPYAAKPGVAPEYVLAFAVMTSFSMLTIAFQQVMHPGLAAFVRAPSMRALRLGGFAAKLCFGLLPLAMVNIPTATTDGYIYPLFAMALGLLSMVSLIIEKSKSVERGLWLYADNVPVEHQMYHERSEQAALNAAAHGGVEGGVGSRRNSRNSHARREESGEIEFSGVLPPSRPRTINDARSAARSRARTPQRLRTPASHSPKATGSPRPRSPPRRVHSVGLQTSGSAVASPNRRRTVQIAPPNLGDRRHTFDPAILAATMAAADAESDRDSDISDDASIELAHQMYEMGVREDEFTEAEDVNAAVVLTG